MPAAGTAPRWARQIEAAYRRRRPWSLGLPGAPEDDPVARLLTPFRPLAESARRRLLRRARELVRRGAPFDAERAVDDLWDPLPERLSWMSARTLVLELHVARLEGRLAGATPEERFADYVDGLARPAGARALLAEYPVLARRAAETVAAWVAASGELLAHLAADHPHLGEMIGGGAPGWVKVLHCAAGDPHRGGRAVAIVELESGARAVYKPRPLAVDLAFQRLLAWLAERGAEPDLRPLAVLDRGGHGWMEYAATAECPDLAAVERFHRRLGALLALLWALEATDVHFENLLAAGEHPVLVDLESLFHPRLPAPPQPQPDLAAATRVLARSVLRVGLLPFRVGAAEDRPGVDISGLAAVAGELAPDRVLEWEGAGTDRMQAVRTQRPMTAGRNRPRLDGREVEALDHRRELLDGFEAMRATLAHHRRALAAPGGPLAAFAGAPVRVVLRATRGYHLLADEGHHPDLLRDGLDRDRHLDRLWLGIDDRPYLERTVPFERRDLAAGDMPYFSTRPGSRDLWASRGERLPGFFAEPAAAAVERNLERLADRREAALQGWLIDAAFTSRAYHRDDVPWPRYEPPPPPPVVDAQSLRTRLLATAAAVGDRLADLRLEADGPGADDAGDDAAVDDAVTWAGLESEKRTWTLAALGEDLYGGTPGIVLALAYLGAATGEARFTPLAERAFATLEGRLRHTAGGLRFLGAFQGWGGLLYLRAHLAALWRRPELLAAEEPYERIAALLAEDEAVDLVAGTAGALACLLAVAEAGGPPAALDLARTCGEALLARAVPAAGGVGWRTQLTWDLPATGFSHGTSGIAWALARLAAATGDERFRDAAAAGFRYERSRWLPEAGNWLDAEDPEQTGQHRREGGEKATSMAWCYGAPGIGLARLGSLAVVDEPLVREDLARALAATRRRGFGFNHCLCHGDLGNLDLLQQAAAALGDTELAREVERRTASVLESIERQGVLCGTPLAAESPGLMNGLAGIALGLARLALPERVPSVLALEPPLSRLG
ncbi:MAG TPA: type 2 lanthipeptide synthetase LanM family protein, partial [Thermoanaerobaculia bacterium]